MIRRVREKLAEGERVRYLKYDGGAKSDVFRGCPFEVLSPCSLKK